MNHICKNNIKNIAISILFSICALPIQAKSVLDDVDLCVDEEKRFKSEQQRMLKVLDVEKTEIENMVIPKDKYRKIWYQIAYQSAKGQVEKRYSGITFTEEQLKQMAKKEVDHYKKAVGEGAVQKEMITYFEEHKKQALEELSTKRNITTSELDQQKNDLAEACGNGEVERILRVVISGVDKRIKSMETEESFDAKLIKFSTGISSADIKKYGLLGGPNSEARKVVKGIENVVIANIEAAKREKGDLNKTIRATTGISINDIKKHGILGGKNSEANKLKRGLGL